MRSSLYADYILERTDDLIIDTKHGFATYRYLNDKQVYIIDIFVPQELRMNDIASDMADQICQKAKEKGCTELLGTVNPSAKKAHESMLVLIAYGMKLHSSSQNIIVFKKDI